ncbi:Ulp1 protease family, C-terminal catalytic domain containing protein [Trema orientale]|uniref:Ulp1 protease family, C-terminal catalytic domain containing protein n=1 Tax=Trema orientale TaxID=63057 RepID=A0A2P5E8S6_TREOI|nr:Ulp1 protease family, C-terminal catalytic domain containing protein [Trema orientale]
MKKGCDLLVIKSDDRLVEYILGYYMHCNTAWSEVDHVLMPVHMETLNHWILVHFDIHSRCLHVYNSLRSASHDKKAKKIVERYSVIIPLLLDLVCFYKSRNDIELSSQYFVNKKATDCLEIMMVDGLSQQTQCDCGVFVFAFAEYFIHGATDKLKDLCVKDKRNKLCVDLYKHACKKQLEGYESDSEFPGRLKDNEIKGLILEAKEDEESELKK